MPSIIPALPVRPTAFNVTNPISLSTLANGGDYIVALGNSLAAQALQMPQPPNPPPATPPLNIPAPYMFTGGDYNARLVNNGSIWFLPNSQTYGSFSISREVDRVVNTGLIVLEITNFLNYDQYNRQDVVVFGSTVGEFNNSGQIFGITTNGNSNIVKTEYDPVIRNSGIMASHAINGIANIFFLHNGGLISNSASGQLLAEGYSACTIQYNRGGQLRPQDTQLDNAGRIDAVSLGGAPSCAIYQVAYSGEHSTFINSGTIKGDYAFYVEDPLVGGVSSVSIEKIINHTGGVITGIIQLDNGDDEVKNDGQIIGPVRMGNGSDRFDSSLGQVTGIVDMGEGNDTYIGSSGNDRVTGERGADRLDGGAGDDLLIGDFGNDILTGGSGNDGLFAEWGNDIINQSGGDWIECGSGDDRVVLNDYTFARVLGNEGFDTLVMAQGPRKTDLGFLVTSGRVGTFEAIELRGNHELIIRSSDVSGFAGVGGLWLITTATDKVDLIGNWLAATNEVINGVTYQVFALAGQQVRVSGGATVAVIVSAPAGGVGFDAVASGLDAPQPGAASGMEASSPYVFTLNNKLSGDTVIEEGEIWYNNGGGTIVQTYSIIDNFTNKGIIDTYNTQYVFPAFAFTAINLRNFDNYGIVSAVDASGIGNLSVNALNISSATLNNYGNIRSEGSTDVVGTRSAFLNNINRISATANGGVAVAAISQQFNNSGEIIAIGGSEATALNGGSVDLVSYNSGYIRSSIAPGSSGKSIGIEAVWGGYVGTIQNSGQIIADIAIRVRGNTFNSPAQLQLNNIATGIIKGDIVLNFVAQDSIRNTGNIIGTVYLNGGNDVYDASGGGTQNGAVYGGDGNDQIVGGITADQLYGDNGDDALKGGLGNDLLFGGSGYDTAYYDATSTASGSAAFRTVAGVAVGGSAIEGSDILSGIEAVRFSDRTVTLNQFTNFAASDANGDGDSDIIFYSQSTGRISRMDYVGGASTAAALVGETVSGNWDTQVTGDFNRDGVTDVVLKDASNGRFYIWTLNASGVQSGGRDLGIIGTNWSVVSTGDYNSDGVADLLWRDSSNGHAYIWMLDANTGLKSSTSLGVLGTNWNIAQSGDFDGDGTSDVMLRNATTGQAYIYYLHDGAYSRGGSVNVFGAAWNVAGVGDFNNDGRSDIILKNGTTGQFYLLAMNGTAPGDYSGSSLGTIGTAWNIAQTGDYNNDGTDDILWRNNSTGQVYMWAMQDGHQAASGSGNVGIFAADAMIV
jgi:Ca2+-binding RTX toxin-like protein